MPIIPCPRCKTPLDVLERSMTGHVRCPSCDEAFSPRTALETAVQVPPLELPPRSEPAPMPRPSRYDDDEPESREERERRRRIRRRRRYAPRGGESELLPPGGLGVALAARIMLGLSAAAEIAFLVLDFGVYARADRQFQASDEIGAIFVFQIFLLIPTGLVFLSWFNSAYRNLGRMRVASLSWAGWTVGGFFLPIGNLFIPLLAAQELWRASQPGEPHQSSRDWMKGRQSAAIFAWWLAWVVANVLFVLAIVMDADNRFDPAMCRAKALVFAAMHVFAAIAATFLIYVIGAVVRRQEAKWAALMPLDDDPASEYDVYDT